ncbi:substrate-binding periplasmic protein [Salidesulfovibrio onnuriiensis]|uniref:substrate-binding periplasmic protein n=1 Tax=Salidesulfovibrio onnuriiensis TaxID=2583823 RepID=UPI0011C82972|nr:transporter substrate-binding domain-containing protein [Salidesulfovibrio onnuriiensis]
MKRLLLVLALVVCFAVPAQAESITFVTNEWPPYASESLEGLGFTSAIVKAACERAGYQAEFKLMPWNRVLNVVKKGEYDAVYNGYFNEERNKIYSYSDPYASGQIVLVTKKGSGVTFDGNLQGLSKYTIGVVKGYANTAEFDAADYLKREDGPNELTNLKKLMGGRVDAVVLDKYVALATIQSDPDLKAKAGEFEILEPALGENKIYAFFSKSRPGADAKLAAFNKGLAAIKADGTIDKIMKQYGF